MSSDVLTVGDQLLAFGITPATAATAGLAVLAVGFAVVLPAIRVAMTFASIGLLAAAGILYSLLPPAEQTASAPPVHEAIASLVADTPAIDRIPAVTFAEIPSGLSRYFSELPPTLPPAIHAELSPWIGRLPSINQLRIEEAFEPFVRHPWRFQGSTSPRYTSGVPGISFYRHGATPPADPLRGFAHLQPLSLQD